MKQVLGRWLRRDGDGIEQHHPGGEHRCLRVVRLKRRARIAAEASRLVMRVAQMADHFRNPRAVADVDVRTAIVPLNQARHLSVRSQMARIGRPAARIP